MKLKLKKNRFLKRTYYFLLIIVGFVLGGCADKFHDFTVHSPEGQLSLIMQNKNDLISYTLLKKGKELIGSSEIAILSNVTKTKIIGSNLTFESKMWEPVWGQFSEIKDVYNELVLDIDLDGKKAKLFVRIYDKGIGFRYQIEGYEEATEADFYCEYNLSGTDALYSSSGENSPIGPFSINEIKLGGNKPSLLTPLVVEQSKKTYLSILESDLYAAPEFDVINFKFNLEKGLLTSSNKTKLKGAKTTTPWRVILVEDRIGDLVTNTVPLNLATPNQLQDASWVTPGKTLWDWRVHGYTADDGFTYGIDTESYMRFIDFAAEKGIEYFLIDDSWYTKVTKGHFELSDKLDLQQVIDYANEKDVQLLLYYDRRHGEYGDDELFKYYRSLGMKGIKYGFMGSNVPFTKDAIKASAENRLLIDFHDGPVPFTGIERTFPNAITKEYCHAQQDSRKAFTPETFIRMALINAIQGPLDMNNGNFDLTGINDGSREKGPKIIGSYLSTVASEAARTLIIHSGLVCIPDAPEAYTKKADLFEFIQKMPVGKWDESKVLHAKMGEYISTARRHGEAWFIGSVYNQKGGVLNIDLDFLKEGENYKVTFYEDTPETHCKTNPEAYQVRTGIVKKGDVIKVKMAPGGGHCMWIRPE
ncbi:glycoside hydrolase family 97 protein [Cellulophaga sp. L1A9]|uniref:glycoside hydrolase family 97 protein n=1 Tax=Cellulophaga sp. L1A9 TaxID=2686362 RepID=UPI00131D3216|nr:glycoside hydrolase family 97 protein [Cellulophaga sp. L1A9]